jgi:mannonate dehydratase
LTIRIGIALRGRGITDINLRLAKQAGFDEIVGRPCPGGQDSALWDYMTTLHLMNRTKNAGMQWTVSESLRIPDAVKLGLPGRGEGIKALCTSIQSLGAVGVSTVVYTWSAMFGWTRTSHSTRVRGDALATSYDHTLMENAPLTSAGVVSEEQLWQSLEYFLKAVLPVAEDAGVRLALHPDDPPLSPIRGVGRIMTSPENFDRALDLVPSPNSGITFCQGCFAEMGVDVPALIQHYAQRGKIFHVHFRNLTGTAEKFTEQFHDDGDVNMYAVMKALHDNGYQGTLRPDHAPTMATEENTTPGYAILGKIFALGYIRGLLTAIEKNEQ